MFSYVKVSAYLSFVVSVAVACNAKQSQQSPSPAEPSAAVTPSGTGAGEAPPAPPSQREGAHVVRSLIAEAARAELTLGGPFVNLGTPDQHKYVDSGWAETGLAGDVLYAVAGKTATLRVSCLRGGVGAVRLRLRGDAGQKLTLYVDGQAIATQPVDKRWRELTYALERPLAAGAHRITLAFNRKMSAVQVDWVWLAPDGERALPRVAKVATASFGGPRRALVADPARSLSYYLVVPRDARLVFDYGAANETRFIVRVAQDGSATKTVFRQTGRSRWSEGVVDLQPWAGKLVRLDLISEGKPGRAGWGEPDLVRPGVAPEVPVVNRTNRAKNVVQILIDTARQDAFKAFNPATRVQTPAMSRLAETSVRFLNAYNTDNWTKPSVATALTGLYSSSHGARTFSAKLPEQAMMLPEHLHGRGFSTAAFIANGYISNKFGFKRGWDHYRNYIRENKRTEAERVYGDAERWLSQRDPHKRFYLYIQTIDPHVAYKVDKAYSSRYFEGVYTGHLGPVVTGIETKKFLDGDLSFDATDKAWVRALYDGEISYHDEYFGKFIDKLRELKLLDDTLIVVSNDHGEEMFDHGRIGHGHSQQEELLRNPLLLRYPKLLPANRAVTEIVELVDVPVTLLELLNVPPMLRMEGRSLLPAIFDSPRYPGYYAFSEFGTGQQAARVGPYKLIATTSREQLFDVVTDRAEMHDLTNSHPIATRACRVYMGEARAVPLKRRRLSATQRKQRLAAPNAEIDLELRKQLEALGYING